MQRLAESEKPALVRALVRGQANPKALQGCQDAPAIAKRIEDAAICAGVEQLELEQRVAQETARRAADPSIERLEKVLRNGTLAGAAIGGVTTFTVFFRVYGIPGGPVMGAVGAIVGAGVALPATFLWSQLAHALKLL